MAPTAGPAPDSVLAAVTAFNDAFNRHDLDAVMAAMTPDCVFVDTAPPDGNRHAGAAAVRAAFAAFFASSPTARFEGLDTFVAGDRVTVRWRYTWIDAGVESHVHGVDVLTFREGKVAEKLAYVKG